MQIYIYIFISLYHLGCSLPAEMNNVVQFFCFSFHISVSLMMPPFNQLCMKSAYKKKKMHTTKQALHLKRPEYIRTESSQFLGSPRNMK